MLLLGFDGAFRRSELVAITVEDLTFSENGVDVFLPKSKTDQEAKGQSVAVLNGKALRPADRLKEWLAAAGITSGPVSRRFNRGDHLTDEPLTAQSIALIVKKYADAAGLDVEKLSGHSLRAGFVTSATDNRASISRIMEVRHGIATRGRWKPTYAELIGSRIMRAMVSYERSANLLVFLCPSRP